MGQLNLRGVGLPASVEHCVAVLGCSVVERRDVRGFEAQAGRGGLARHGGAAEISGHQDVACFGVSGDR